MAKGRASSLANGVWVVHECGLSGMKSPELQVEDWFESRQRRGRIQACDSQLAGEFYIIYYYLTLQVPKLVRYLSIQFREEFTYLRGTISTPEDLKSL